MTGKITQNDSVVVIEFPKNPTLGELNKMIDQVKPENKKRKIMFMETKTSKDGTWKLFVIFELI